MNHARLLMVSAVMSALAACGGGGGDSSSNATSTSSANSSASATSNVTVNIDGLTMPAARQAVEQANESAGAAQQRLMEAQTALAAEQAREDAAARQQQIAEQQAAVTRAQEAAAAEARAAAEAQAKLAAVIQRDAPAAAAPTTEILDCSRNAAVVTDADTGLQLVCESQITTGATTADVGTNKHASGRYYALPFPDKSMIFAGNKVAYKMACGQKICEWSKMGGSMDIAYAAQGKDGKYYRFTSCRKGDADRVICAYPRTGVPDGIDAWFDDREPEAPRIGAVITETGADDNRRFRAAAELSAPIGCGAKIPQEYTFPWPGKERFTQVGENRWAAVFDGGNCLGDVRVSVLGTPDAPSAQNGSVMYSSSASSWPFDRATGPDGKALEQQFNPLGPRITSAAEAASYAEMVRANPSRFYRPGYFRPMTQATSADAVNSASTSTNGAATATPANPATTAPAATPATSPATDSSGTTGASGTAAQDNGASGTTGTATGANGGQTDAGTGAGSTAAGTTAATGGASVQPDSRNTDAGTATNATQTPPTSAGMFQQQRNEPSTDPDTRTDSDGAFPWNGNGSVATYGGRQITTVVQPNGDIIYRTSSGEIPFDRALDANGNVLRSVAETCRDVDGDGQECTFRAAA